MLDQQVVNLAKSIRQVETGNRPVSGASGETASRYQFMPDTWKGWAKKYLGNENAEISLENENKVAYSRIKEWKDQGYGPDQIASMWNSGSPEWKGKVGVNDKGVKYDVPSYVSKVGAEYQKLKGSTIQQEKPMQPTISANKQADIETAQRYGATFAPNTENPSMIAEPLKTAANVPSSAYNLAKGLFGSVRELANPVNIYKNIKELGSVENVVNALKQFPYKKAATILPEAIYKTAVPEATQGIITAGKGYLTGNEEDISKGLETTQRALVSDPVGQILPYILGAKGISEKAGVGAKFDTAISKTAQTVINPAKNVFGKAAEVAGKATKFGVGQTFGLEPETVSQITKNPAAFKSKALQNATRENLGAEVESVLAERRKAAGISPETLAADIERGYSERGANLGITKETLGKEIQSALNKRASTLSETGTGYNEVRTSTAPIKVSKNWIDTQIKELTGLNIKNGKISATGSSALRDATDIRAVQHLYDLWKPSFSKGKMTSNEFLNFRSDLAGLSKFERQIGKSQPIESFAKVTRGRFNEAYRPQLEGLEKLDLEFGTQTKALKELSRGILDKKGNLTDSGLAKIVKATEEKPQLIAQLDEISPGISAKIKALQEQAFLGKGLIDKNGNITDAGIRKLSNASPKEQPALLERLETISPGITKKINTLNEIRAAEKGLVDDAGNITDRGLSRIVNAANEANPGMLERLKKIIPDIEEKIKITKAAEDITRAKGSKVGTYGRIAIPGAAYIFTGNPVAAAGAWILSKLILNNPDVGVWMLRKYGEVKASKFINTIASGLSQVNKLPEETPAFLKKGVKPEELPLGMSIKDVSKKSSVFGKKASAGEESLMAEARKYATPEELITEIGEKFIPKTIEELAIDYKTPKEFIEAIKEMSQPEEIARKFYDKYGKQETIEKFNKTLTDIWNKSNKKIVKTGEEALIAEARKYKTAEEFEKAILKSDSGQISDNPFQRQVRTEKFIPLPDKNLLTKNKINIYRVTARNEIAPGDIVALNNKRAEFYIKSKPNSKLLKLEISPNDLKFNTNGDYIYAPNGITSLKDFWNEVNKKSSVFGAKTKKIHPEDLAEMSDFTDYVAKEYKPDPATARQLELSASRIAEKYGIKQYKTVQGLANEFGRILEEQGFKKTKSVFGNKKAQ